ncbi:ROK family protein [Asaia sp. BMEF1]|uniref:ROK family protein n=1 Tax=Asaia sp. BMEF1 TaxID=3155932 RepID=UPI003F665029
MPTRTNLTAPTLLCADIGGSHMRLAWIDDDLNVIERRQISTPSHDLDRFIESFAELVRESHRPVTAAHLSLAGLQDPVTARCIAANIPCINDVSLAPLMSKKLGLPVRIANDADCFTLAEARAGAAKGHDNVFGIILGTGVGGGLVQQGNLVVGRQGLTGEWGHGPFLRRGDRDYPYLPCGCGQSGCLDTIGGARGLEKLHLWLCGEACSSRDIINGWLSEKSPYHATVTRYIDLLSDALAIVINITGASCVPAGGGLSAVEQLVTALDQAVREKCLYNTDTPIIVRAKLGDDAGLIGASYL